MTVSTKNSVFKNEPFTDFLLEENKQAMQAALVKVKKELGQTYPLTIGKDKISTEEVIVSTNPGKVDEVIGRVSRGTKAYAEQAMQEALAAFQLWKNVPPAERADYLFKAAELMRERKYEFSAMLVYEVGKTGQKLMRIPRKLLTLWNFMREK